MPRRDQVPWGRRQGLPHAPPFGPPGGWPGGQAEGFAPAPGRVLVEGLRSHHYGSNRRTLGANGTDAFSIRFASDLGFVATTMRLLLSNAAARATLTLTEEKRGRPWSNTPVRAELVTGDGRFPYVLPAPVFFPPYHTLAVVIAETAGQAGFWDLVIGGYKLLSSTVFSLTELQALSRQSPFFYQIPITIAAGVGVVTGPVPLQTHDDGDFVCEELQADVRTAWSAQLKTVGKVGDWSDVPIAAEDLFGDGQRPGTLDAPVPIPGGDTVQLTATNRQAGAQTVRVVLGGSKVWK